MSVTNPGVAQPRADRAYEARAVPTRRSTETKASFKTTEFFAYIGILIAIFVAGAVTKAGSDHNDVFRASQVWLYATILSIGYMISRGLAKAGSREPDTEERYSTCASRSGDFLLAAAMFIASGGHVLLLPLFVLLPLSRLLGHRRRHRRP